MYNKLEASLHDVFWEAEGKSAEQPILENFLQAYPGTALELGCGSGRLLLPLLREGYLTEGLDSSQDMLALCRDRAGQLSPVLHHASMEDFQTGTVYGAIAIPAFTLQLLSYEQTASALTNIREHLHPGGGLYFTTFIPWAEITGELEEGEWFLDQEAVLPNENIARCHTRFQIMRLSQQLTREHRYEILSPDNKVLETSKSTHHLTWYWPRETRELLQRCGFTIDQTIGDFDGACDDNSQIVTTIARRSPGE